MHTILTCRTRQTQKGRRGRGGSIAAANKIPPPESSVHSQFYIEAWLSLPNHHHHHHPHSRPHHSNPSIWPIVAFAIHVVSRDDGLGRAEHGEAEREPHQSTHLDRAHVPASRVEQNTALNQAPSEAPLEDRYTQAAACPTPLIARRPPPAARCPPQRAPPAPTPVAPISFETYQQPPHVERNPIYPRLQPLFPFSALGLAARADATRLRVARPLFRPNSTCGQPYQTYLPPSRAADPAHDLRTPSQYLHPLAAQPPGTFRGSRGFLCRHPGLL
ncbi:hypothetical protein BS50DRAFT_215364 [Corynespora cassiicola Philippines]|uniref:Uncharacterized protein n=1 Tax=Corynespora cassiicola Philippines TaxID=1448308 RepID=A0A2T2N4D6_CORCC|nr:hypothetical protein BS50DRAFT_215364 [Corynespora cassiicola Philippines]